MLPVESLTFLSSFMNEGKFFERFICLLLMDDELSIMKRRSSFGGVTSRYRPLTCFGWGTGFCNGCEVQAHRAKGRAGMATAHRRTRQRVRDRREMCRAVIWEPPREVVSKPRAT